MIPFWLGLGVREDFQDGDGLEGVRAVALVEVAPWFGIESDAFLWTGFSPRTERPTNPDPSDAFWTETRDAWNVALLAHVSTPWPRSAQAIRARPCLLVGADAGMAARETLYQARYVVRRVLVPHVQPVVTGALEVGLGEFVLRGGLGIRGTESAHIVATADLVYGF